MLPEEGLADYVRTRLRFADGKAVCPKSLYEGYPDVGYVLAAAVDLKEWRTTGMIEGPASEWPCELYHLIQHARGTQNGIENSKAERMEKDAAKKNEPREVTVQ